MNSPHSAASTVRRINNPLRPLPAGAPAAARTAFKLLSRLKHGTLTLQLPDGSTQRFGSGASPTACLRLNNWKVCSAALRSGAIGFAASYIPGDWTTPQLSELFPWPL